MDQGFPGCRLRAGFEFEFLDGELKGARLSWPSLAFLEVADLQPLGKRSSKKKEKTLNPKP